MNKATNTTEIEPADLGIQANALVISTALTAGTWTFSGLGEKKATISSVLGGMNFAGLTNGSTVAVAESVGDAAITVNDVAFTGIAATNAGDVTFTVGATTSDVSAALRAANAAVTVPAGAAVKVGTTTYTTGAASASFREALR